MLIVSEGYKVQDEKGMKEGGEKVLFSDKDVIRRLLEAGAITETTPDSETPSDDEASPVGKIPPDSEKKGRVRGK